MKNQLIINGITYIPESEAELVVRLKSKEFIAIFETSRQIGYEIAIRRMQDYPNPEAKIEEVTAWLEQNKFEFLK